MFVYVFFIINMSLKKPRSHYKNCGNYKNCGDTHTQKEIFLICVVLSQFTLKHFTLLKIF